jgi:hypothetical protein
MYKKLSSTIIEEQILEIRDEQQKHELEMIYEGIKR